MAQDQSNTLMTYLPVVSLVVSFVSAGIAVASFNRTRKLQEFDYAARLQVADESIYGQGPGPDDAFTYEANIENRGQKPVKVDSVYLDYGGKESLNKRLKHYVEGEFYLGAGEKRKISFRLRKNDFNEALKKFEIDQCYFYLRVRFFSPTGTIIETTRPLMGLGENSNTIFARKGEILS